MELDWQNERLNTNSSGTYLHRVTESSVRSPQLMRFETTSSPHLTRTTTQTFDSRKTLPQGRYTASFNHILESTYKLLEEIKSNPKPNIPPAHHHFKSSELRLSSNSVFNQTYRSPLRMNTITQSDYRSEDLGTSFVRRSAQKEPRKNSKLIIDESYKLINEIKNSLNNSRANFEKMESQIGSLVYKDPLRSPDSQVNIGTMGTHFTTENERLNSRMYNLGERLSSQVFSRGKNYQGRGSENQQSMVLGERPAESYSVSVANSNYGTGQRGFLEPNARSQKNLHRTASDTQNIRIEEGADVINQPGSSHKKAESTDLEHSVSQHFYSIEQNYNTEGTQEEGYESRWRDENAGYSPAEAETPAENQRERETDSEDISQVLGFTKSKKEVEKKKNKKGGKQEFSDGEDMPKPNAALKIQPQQQIPTEKISLTITSYKPKATKESKINIAKSYDGLKYPTKSIDGTPAERSIDSFGGSIYSSVYNISTENVRNSKVFKKENTLNGKARQAVVSPKGTQNLNQRYFHPGAVASRKKMM